MAQNGFSWRCIGWLKIHKLAPSGSCSHSLFASGFELKIGTSVEHHSTINIKSIHTFFIHHRLTKYEKFSTFFPAINKPHRSYSHLTFLFRLVEKFFPKKTLKMNKKFFFQQKKKFESWWIFHWISLASSLHLFCEFANVNVCVCAHRKGLANVHAKR